MTVSLRTTFALASVAASMAFASAEPAYSQTPDVDAPVVRNEPAAEAPVVWTVDAEPIVEIGGSETDPHQQLFQVVMAARLDDGRMVVATAGDHQLRFYDAEGDYLSSAGGEGEAPGEFRSFSTVQVGPDDSIYVYDRNLQRVTVLGDHGELQRTSRVRTGTQPVAELRRFRDGRWYGIDGDRLARGPSGSLQRDTANFLLFGSGLRLESRIAALPGMMTANAGAGGKIYRGAPFTPRPAYDELGDCLYLTSGDDFDVRVLSSDGRAVRIIRNDGTRPSVSSADLSAWTERMIEEEGITNLKRRKMARKVARMLPHPGRHPAYRSLIVDAGGYIWLQLYTSPDGLGRQWAVLDPVGELVGRVRMPAAVEVFQVGRDWILAEGRDDLGREYVRLYRLDREGWGEATPPSECTADGTV